MIDRNSIAKEQARLLREKGMGYKRIAGITGLTRDAVRNTCKKIGAVQEDGTLFDRIQEGSACTYCGGAMEQHSGSGRPRRFCTENCRRQYWRLHRLEQKRREDKLFLRTCAYCGRTFQIYGKKETGGGNEKYTFRVWLKIPTCKRCLLGFAFTKLVSVSKTFWLFKCKIYDFLHFL